MAKLIYSAITSLDGYVADQDGNFDWAEPDEELQTVSSARTRIERVFDLEAVRQMKASAIRDISVGGPDLAAAAIKAGLVDECHLFIAPIVVGGGKQSLPDSVRMDIELLDVRRFGNGVVHLHYRTRT